MLAHSCSARYPDLCMRCEATLALRSPPMLHRVRGASFAGFRRWARTLLKRSTRQSATTFQASSVLIRTSPELAPQTRPTLTTVEVRTESEAALAGAHVPMPRVPSHLLRRLRPRNDQPTSRSVPGRSGQMCAARSGSEQRARASAPGVARRGGLRIPAEPHGALRSGVPERLTEFRILADPRGDSYGVAVSCAPLRGLAEPLSLARGS